MGWLLIYCSYGFDFTDESYYLVSISNPFIYSGSITQFGFIYHSLYLILDSNISQLRQANVLITFILAFCLIHTLLSELTFNKLKSSLPLIIIALGFSTISLISFSSFTTPSYNSLALQGLMITGLGLILAGRNTSIKSVFGWLCIGVGGWLVFMAKPSSAVTLGAFAFVYILFARKFELGLVALAVLSSLTLFLISGFIIDGSVIVFIERLLLGIDFGFLLDKGDNFSKILRIDNFEFNRFEHFVFVVITSTIAIFAAWTGRTILVYISVAMSLILTFLIIVIIFVDGPFINDIGKYSKILILGTTLSAAAFAIVLVCLKKEINITKSQWGLTGFFIVMPHIYAIGTTSNYWKRGGEAAIFWLLPGIILLRPLILRHSKNLHILVPLVFISQLLAVSILKNGMDLPYRQNQAYRHNTATVNIGPNNSKLILSKDVAEQLKTVTDVAHSAHFEPGIPMIDLTGQSPGILYTLGAESIGLPWLLGNYTGSLDLAKAALNETSCEKISLAWLLIEPNGPRSLPLSLLSILGANFPDNYKRVGIWNTAKGVGGYSKSRVQYLYQPNEPMRTFNSCKEIRRKVEE